MPGEAIKVSQLMFSNFSAFLCFSRSFKFFWKYIGNFSKRCWLIWSWWWNWTAWYLLQVLACHLVAEGQKLWFTSSSNCSINMEASAFVIFFLQVYSWDLAFHSYFFGLVLSRFSMYSRVVLALLPLPICM